MTLAQAQNLTATLIGLNCSVTTDFDAREQTWIVRATKPNDKVTSATMTSIAAGVVPSSPTVSARTDRAEFL